MTTQSRLTGLFLAIFLSSAQADINVGVTLSATGPAASLGIPEKNTIALMPTSVAGHKINYFVLDDATDPTSAVKNVNKLVSESRVDVVIGSTTVPTTLAVVALANDSATPLITMAPVEPTADKLAWVFMTPQTNALMAEVLIDHMVKNGVKSLGYIGFADPYGEGWWNEISRLAKDKKIKIVASERYQRADTSVTGQVLKIVVAKPDAVLIGASGTPAVLPQATLTERGYQGKIYQTHAVANKDFLRVGGKTVEGAILPTGPIIVAEQLPDSHPSKAVALSYIEQYEAVHGSGSSSAFGGYAWDAGLLMQHAVTEALKTAQPGTAEFRKAVREALENTQNLAGTHGVYNKTAKDHTGLDQRAVVMVKIENGAWKLMQ